MTQADFELLHGNDDVKIVRHVPVNKLKLVVSAYRTVGAKVVSTPEQGKKNEYVVTAQFN